MTIPGRKRYSLIFSIGLAASLITAPASAECRFWAAAGELSHDLAIEQLLLEPNALKHLGQDYEDGWSVGYYTDRVVQVDRGSDPANTDINYDNAVFKAARQGPQVIVSHLRQASSGCVQGVPNPHPFKRSRNGQVWLFGHNGTIPKPVLIALIGEDYLAELPPEVCSYDPPDSWIDSELYFLFLLKRIEETGWQVEAGLKAALKELYTALGEERKALNFFLTDGTDVWAFRKGPSLYYTHQTSPFQAVVASTPPPVTRENWQDVGDDNLLLLRQGAPPQRIPLF